VAALNIKTGERERVDVHFLAQALSFTMADFSSQLFDWQDQMFENSEDGRLRYAGSQPQWWAGAAGGLCPGRLGAEVLRVAPPVGSVTLRQGCGQGAERRLCLAPPRGPLTRDAPNRGRLWPGEMKPGLWMHALSKMAALLRSCNERLAAAGDARGAVPLPPVFDRCSRVLPRTDERAARDAYWRAVTELAGPARASEARAALSEAAAQNPYIAEPHALLAQIALQAGDAAAAEAEATEALRLFCEWGTAWDKASGGGWVGGSAACGFLRALLRVHALQTFVRARAPMRRPCGRPAANSGVRCALPRPARVKQCSPCVQPPAAHVVARVDSLDAGAAVPRARRQGLAGGALWGAKLRNGGVRGPLPGGGGQPSRPADRARRAPRGAAGARRGGTRRPNPPCQVTTGWAGGVLGCGLGIAPVGRGAARQPNLVRAPPGDRCGCGKAHTFLPPRTSYQCA
jgi:hypothetical protein